MSGLLDSLSWASDALNAQRMGLDVVGQNMANVNTEGYSRRRLQLAELPPTDPLNAGRGVQVTGVVALRDRFIQGRLNQEQQSAAFSDARVRQLQVYQTALGLPGSGLDARLAAFFDSYQTLANDATSPTARDNVVAQGKSLALAFNDQAGRLNDLLHNTDAQVRSSVDEINTLAKQVAQLNDKIINTAGIDVEALRDQRDLAVARLAELGGVTATLRNDDAIDLVVGNGLALVVGGDAFKVDVTSTGPSGLASISVSGTDVTANLKGGQLGALLEVRDTTIPGYQNQIDQLAYGVAGAINAAHAAGYDVNGNPAGNFFTPPGAVAGAAAALSVDAAVAADSRLVAASGTGAVGDNQTARAIADLRDARFLNGGTATASEAWSQLVYSVGADISSAQADSTTHAQVVLQLQKLRDAASGVSLDEEAALLLKYQRAYEANARYFTTISDTLDTLLGLVR